MKQNPILAAIRLLFPVLEKISPSLSDRLFYYLFLRTFPYKYTEQQANFLEASQKRNIRINGKRIPIYHWGTGDRYVLFVHGWMGHSAQFQSMINRFLDEGYRCIAFDAPGHGGSEGNSSSVVEFRDAITLIDGLYGSPEMIIGHSLGGAAAVLANKEDRLTGKMILISSPTTGSFILKSFAHGIGASEDRFGYLKYRIYKDLGIPFSQAMLTETIPQMTNTSLLLIYDDDDKVLHFDHASQIKDLKPHTKLIRTKGLGHNRILRDQRVIEYCTQFLHAVPEGKLEENKIAATA